MNLRALSDSDLEWAYIEAAEYWKVAYEACACIRYDDDDCIKSWVFEASKEALSLFYPLLRERDRRNGRFPTNGNVERLQTA